MLNKHNEIYSGEFYQTSNNIVFPVGTNTDFEKSYQAGLFNRCVQTNVFII